MIGKLITVPNSGMQSGFAKEDIKWKDIKKMNDNRSDFKELSKDNKNGNITSEYKDCYIEFANVNKININSSERIKLKHNRKSFKHGKELNKIFQKINSG